MRTIGVVTSSRADYGIYFPILQGIQADPDLKLHLLVTGMHLAPEFGRTVEHIERDGFPIAEQLETLLASDTPTGIAKSMGLAVQTFAESFSRFRPDILMILGDRFEMAAAPLAALPFKIPVAHLHGGEVTQGAIDDALRHTMTKLSHLHFVSTEIYAQRVRQLGEEPWRIHTVGAPSLDNLRLLPLLSSSDLAARLGFSWEIPPILVTFHPVTLEHEQTAWHIGELLAALEEVPNPIIFTLSNADTSGRIIHTRVNDFVQHRPNTYLVDNLGTQAYFSLMQVAAMMVGNSSSGILEAASFQLPVVNIGSRQTGRIRAQNVIDVDYPQAAIQAGVKRALSADFRASLADLINPYGDGHATERILDQLKTVALDERLVSKQFYDYEGQHV